MIALHFRDSPTDLFRRASHNCREAAATSAVCPFAKTGIPVPSALDTHAYRASIDSQFLLALTIASFFRIVNTFVFHLRTFVSSVKNAHLFQVGVGYSAVSPGST